LDQDSCCNELVLVGEIQDQVRGHKRTISYGTLSCVPFEHSPLPCYLMKLTFMGLKELDLEHLHNTNNARCQQQPQIPFVRKDLTQNQIQLFYRMSASHGPFHNVKY
jgi:hypothetical protein